MCRKYIFLLVFLFFISFLGFSFAVLEGIGYTDVTFTWVSISGVQLPETNYLITQLTGGTTGTFSVKITNPTTEDITLKIDFFDQATTADGEGNKACSRIHTSNDFWSNLLWDTWSFVVASGASVIRIVTWNYSSCFTGQSLWCLVQTLTGDVVSWSFTVSLGKANFIDFTVFKDTFNCNKYSIKALPSQRSSNFTFSGFMAFWINDIFANISTGNITSSWNVLFDSGGIGNFTYTIPNTWSWFLVLLKSNSFLSVGYTWIYNGSSIDFTNLTGLAPSVYTTWWFDLYTFLSLPLSQWSSWTRSLLVWWDTNNNDYIWASDLALINNNLTVNLSPSDYRYDLNNDSYVTSADQAIMIQNVTRNGFWRNFKNMLTGWFATGNDVTPAAWQFPWN